MSEESRERLDECRRMSSARNQGSQIIGEFIEWLGEQGYTICEDTGSEVDNYWPTSKRTEQLLADFFGIDLNEVEAERRRLLENLRDSRSWDKAAEGGST